MKNKMPNGYTIYDGPSLIDNMPIICVALTGKSRNSKTGAMMQTVIIRKDIPPIEANRIGADYSICGECPHKGTPTNKDKGTAAAETPAPDMFDESFIEKATAVEVERFEAAIGEAEALDVEAEALLKTAASAAR